MHLSIALPLRNEAALDEELQQLYSPNSSSYHHFLTVEQFTEQVWANTAGLQRGASSTSRR